MKKIATFVLLTVLASLAARATVLFKDSTYYPSYTNGCIEGQGLWYCYSPATPSLDALMTNHVLLLNATNHDEVSAPTNGWTNPTEYNFASFSINVSQLPSSTNGGYFCQFQNTRDTNDCCHVFIDTRDTVVPGTYRLGIANFATSFSALTPPVNYPLDLATGITYTVVVLFDTNQDNSTFVGSTLWINPSPQDYQNLVDAGGLGSNPGDGYVFGVDTTTSDPLLKIKISEIGFSPFANAGISNVITGNTFADVNTTNAPVFGIQPQSVTNYSGNSTMFYAVASGADVIYQWHSASGGLLQDDGVNIIGSSSNILIINNLSASDNYYAVATDFYGVSATSATATNTVITTPTLPFFTDTPVNLTNNLFTQTGFTNLAKGTGPLSYQWYFAPTNAPNTYSALLNQTNSALNLNLADYSFSGNYFVVASNALNGGSITYGPTNSLMELAPLVATISQLHNLMISMAGQIVANKNGTIFVNTNNVTVSGYVTTFGGFGSTYSEFFLQDAEGFGIEVFLGGFGNTNSPPAGSYVTVSGPVEIFHTELEIAPAAISAVVTSNTAPVIPIGPRVANASFNDLSTNALGTNALLTCCSLVTFTNVYIYGSKTGGPISAFNNGLFPSNTTAGSIYFTIGQYHVPDNTNWLQCFEFCYNYASNGVSAAIPNPFDLQPIPTNCYQLTGIYVSFGGSPEIIPSRLADYVTNPPPAYAAGIMQSNGVATIKWPAQYGSTYTLYSAPNATGPWTPAAYGLAYFPTNGVVTDTNVAPAKYYRLSTP